MSSPKVTIAIPVYNEEKFLYETLSSVVNQTYKNITVIISNNNSSDTSQNIIDDFKLKYPETEVYIQPQTITPFEHFHFLLNKASTKYFMWLGGHDVLKNTFIEQAINFFTKQQGLICVYSKTSFIKDGIFLDSIRSDNVTTINLGFPERVLKIIENINYGNAVYGLYDREVLNKSMVDMNGGDLLILLRASQFGYYLETADVNYYFRSMRGPESESEQNIRYKKYGFADNWRLIHANYPFQICSHYHQLSFLSRMKLLTEVYWRMQTFYKLKWLTIVFYHLKKFDLKTAIYSTCAMLLALLRKIKYSLIKPQPQA